MKLQFQEPAINNWWSGSFSIIVCFLLLSMFSNYSYGQTISINEDNIRVELLLQKITDQSGLNFSYNTQLLNKDERLDFQISNANLESTLDLLVEKLDISYTLVEKQIILHEKKIGLNDSPKIPLYTISGFINDAQSGESLIGATVSVKGTSQGVSTNAFGYYALQLPKGHHTLLFSYVGFEAQRMLVNLSSNQKQNIPLQPVSMELPGVTISSKEIGRFQNIQSGSMDLLPEELSQMPEFGGESGLIRGLHALPGIKAHSDGSAFFFVRGGNKDQNLIILDDAPIYNPSHLFGFYSVVVPDVAKSIKVYKSDIPVNLGDRLSSVIDIRTKDGNLNKTELNMAFNPLLNSLAVEGPIWKERSSYFLSFRGSNFKWLYKKDNPDADIGFSDFNFKWNIKLNKKNRLYYTLFVGDDRFENTSIRPGFSGLGWRNVASTLRWNHIFGDRLFMNATVYSGNYNYRLQSNANRWDSSIGRASLKTDFTYYHNNNQTSQFGLESNGFTFNPGGVSGEGFASFFPKIEANKTQQFVLYYNRNFEWKDRWHANLGLRGTIWQNFGTNTYYTFDDEYEVVDSILTDGSVYNTYRSLDPRASVQYEIDTSSSIKLSYGMYHQFIQLIGNSVSPFTSLDVWLPANPNIKPQRAQQVTLRYQKHFSRRDLLFSGELYYKKMYNQIDYEDHADILLNPLVEGELRFGEMQSYGLELMLRKQSGRLNGWLSYTLSQTRQQTDEINGGRAYPAFQDRPHDLSLMLNYRIKRRILFSAFYTWYSGAAFSSPTGFYTFNGRTIPIYDEKHNDRLPNYNRLDIAFKFILNKKPNKRFQHDLTFSVYNFLAHKNVVAVNFNKIPRDDLRPIIQADLSVKENLSASQIDLIRFLPSLTYSFKL